MRDKRTSGILLVIFATAFWSTSGLFINIVVDASTITPLALAFWRDLTTFAVLLLSIAVLQPSLLRIRRADIPWFAGMGAVGIGIFHVLWNMSILHNGLAISTVIQCNSPVFVTLLARVIWREPLTWRKLSALVLAAPGTILVARLDHLAGAEISTVGLVVAIGSSLAYSAITLFTKKLTGAYKPWTILLYAFGFAALALLPFQFSLPLPSRIQPAAAAAFMALVLLTTILGYVTYTLGLARIQASIASIIAVSEVPMASAIGWVAFNERLDGWQIVGAMLVMGSVLILSLHASVPIGDRPRQNGAASR